MFVGIGRVGVGVETAAVKFVVLDFRLTVNVYLLLRANSKIKREFIFEGVTK